MRENAGHGIPRQGRAPSDAEAAVRLRQETRRQRLLDLSAIRPPIGTFEGARYANEASRESWTVSQVLGTRLHDARR